MPLAKVTNELRILGAKKCRKRFSGQRCYPSPSGFHLLDNSAIVQTLSVMFDSIAGVLNE
jgi:hypothetical protein